MLTCCETNESIVTNLRDAVEVAFSRNLSLSVRHVRVETHADHVVLRGFVRSYYQKHMAQETLKSIPGVRRIDNEIEVITP
jgi:osmotically-inducible protein OsmY